MSSVPVQTIQQSTTQTIGLERDRKALFPIAKRALDIIGAGVGLLLLFAVLSFARPLVNLWLAPAFILRMLAERLYFPYLLPNPFA